MPSQTVTRMKRILGAALVASRHRRRVRSRSATPTAGRAPRRPVRRAGGASSRSASPSPVAPLGTVRLALDWTPNTNHTGFYVARGQRLVRRGGRRPPDPALRQHDPEALIAAGQAECGISFQDALTFAAAAGAPVVSVMAILQHTAQEIAVLASSDIDATEGPRRPDLRRLRLPERGADAQERDQGRRRHRHVHDRHPRHRRVRGALRQARRFRDHVRGLGGHRGEGAGHRASDVQVRRLRLPRLLPGRPRLRQPLAGSRARPRSRLRRRDGPRLRARRGRSRRAPPRCWSPRTRASSTGTRTLPLESQRFLAEGGYLRDESGAVGRQTLAKWQGYSGFLFEQGLLSRPGRQAARDRARLRGTVHQRLPAVRPSPAWAAGDRRSPWPRSSSWPGRGTSAWPGSTRSRCRRRRGWSARCGTSARPRSATSSRRWSRRSSGAAFRSCSPSRRPSRSTDGSPSAGRSSRCSSPARRSRSWPSRRCSSSGSGSACCPRSSSSCSSRSSRSRSRCSTGSAGSIRRRWT